MSASLDNTVRLWDLRSPNPQGQLNLTTPYLCAYDPTATVMAIASPAAQSILLYDSRNYDKAPFATFDLQDTEAGIGGAAPPPDWTKLEFSNDGRRILVATNGPGHYVLDGYEGHLQAYCVRPQGRTDRASPAELGALRKMHADGPAKEPAGSRPKANGQGDACLSPDGRYVVSGSGEAGLFVWDLVEGDGGDAGAGAGASGDGGGEEEAAGEAEGKMRIKTLQPSADLSSKGTGAAAVVAYNPRHNLLVTADEAVVFWLPEMD